jgi:hypothetical protein
MVRGRIPNIYQEVEWIGSNGLDGNAAYINLGFAFDKKARIEMGQVVTTNLTTGYAFGAAENSGKLRCMLTSPNAEASNCIFYGSSGSAYITSQVTISANAINKFVFVLDLENLYVVNETTGSEKTNTTQGTYVMNNNLYLFAQNYNGAARFAGIIRIAYFKYYDKNGTLICDLVPCYRKSDGVIGMYDIIRDTFLVNAGSDTFEKGTDVTG